MPEDDRHNPETAAIGLDVAALEGKSIAEVRRIVDRDDCTLVLATEDVPRGLPKEVMDKEPAVHEGKPSLSWMYQNDAGEWRHWYSYGVDHDYVRRVGDPPTEIILAQIYTKRSRATRQGEPGSTQPITSRLRESDQRLEVTSPAGTQSFDVVDVRRADSDDSILISARRK